MVGKNHIYVSLVQEPTLSAVQTLPAPTTKPSALRPLLLAIIPLFAIYLLMLNPYWVPSGDGEVYTAIARSLYKGEGFMFNGARAAICPPGWPLVLSWLMRISPEFWFLKFCVTTFMLGSLASMFFIVRRFLDDYRSAGVIFLTGILSTLYPLTYFMHTEGFFCLLTSLSILIAFRIGENRAGWIEYALMLGCLGMACFARWPGVLTLLLIAPALYRPGVKFLSPRILITLILAIALSTSTIYITMSSLKMSKTEAMEARAAGGSSESEIEALPADQYPEIATPTTVSTTIPVQQSEEERLPELVKKPMKNKSYFTEYSIRIADSGKWFSWLLWQPTRFAQSAFSLPIGRHFTLDPSDFLGWSIIGLLGYTLFKSIRRREWFWVGMAAYTGGLVVLWPNPNARYFVPVAPFILLGVFVALFEIQKSKGWTKSTNTIGWIFVATIVLVNVPLLCYDVYVFRSGDRFYKKYEAGANLSLIEICQQINRDPRTDVKIAVSERYENMGRLRYSKFGVRAAHLLTNRKVIGVDTNAKVSRPPDDDRGENARRWAVRNDVEYFLYQVPSDPWRVWHFRMPDWLQSKLTQNQPIANTLGWTVWQRRDPTSKRYRQVTDLPELDDPWPTRVPGID